MATLTDEVQIDCPSAIAFDLLVDLRNELRWNANVSEVELVSGEPIGIGSRFVVEDKRGEHRSTITAFERPGRVDFATTAKEMDLKIKYSFTESDGTTTVVGTFEAKPRGVMKALLPLLKPLIKRDLAKQHQSFKNLCESQTG
ncbi:MAG: SRPBCC family protein [Acidimicrobiales bacterium]